MTATVGRFTKDDAGKTRFNLIPPGALKLIADVLTYGAKKYNAHNWCQNADWSRYIDALERHWNSWKAGEDVDPESGHHHLAHAGCCLLFLLAYQIHGIGEDDRISHVIDAAIKANGRNNRRRR
jgi:hypothetical protein